LHFPNVVHTGIAIGGGLWFIVPPSFGLRFPIVRLDLMTCTTPISPDIREAIN
jgi:hypothetical protein